MCLRRIRVCAVRRVGGDRNTRLMRRSTGSEARGWCDQSSRDFTCPRHVVLFREASKNQADWTLEKVFLGVGV